MKKKRNYKKLIIIILIIALFIGGGVFAYFKFFNKDKTNYFDIYNSTFKTDDGKELTFYVYSDETISEEALSVYKDIYLKMCQSNDKSYDLSYCEDAKNNKVELLTYSSTLATHFNGIDKFYKYNRKLNYLNYGNYVREFAKFDGKTIGIYAYNFNTQYGLYAGNELSNGGRAPYDYYFLIDFNTGKVIQYNEEMSIITHTVHDKVNKSERTLDTTFFAKKEKNSLKYKVYTTNFKYLGDILSTPNNMMDDDGHVYVINDGIISIYDEKGNKVKSLSKIDNIIDFTVFNNVCLALIYENKNLYLYDFSDNSRVKLAIDEHDGLVNGKNYIDGCYFNIYSDNILNNEVVIEGLKRGSVYDYTTKTLKNSSGSNIYSNGKDIIELEEYDSVTDDNGNVTKKYYLYDGGKEYKVEALHYQINDNTMVITYKKTIYVLNTKEHKLITKYTTKNELDYNDEESFYPNDTKHSGIRWFTIYDGSEFDNGNIVVIANSAAGEIFRFNNNYPMSRAIINDELYLQYKDKIIKYDVDGDTLKTATYTKTIKDDDNNYIYSKFVFKGNDLYRILLDENYKEEKLTKVATYGEGKSKFDIYQLKGKEDTENYIYINDQVHTVYSSTEDKKDETYETYLYGSGQCGINVIVDKKKNEIIKNEMGVGFLNTKVGYFFTKYDCPGEGPGTLYTTNWKKLGYMVISEIETKDGVYVYDDKYIKVVNADGEEIRRSKKEYDTIYDGIQKNDKVYINIYENKKMYIVTLDEELNEIARVEVCSKYNWSTIDIDIDGNMLLYCYGDDTNKSYIYDPNSQKFTERKDD